MAAFNKAENEAVVSTGLSNSSRGMPADQSLGTLFEGIGNTLQNGLNAYDESTKVKIQMAADEAVNGPNGAVAAATPDAEGNLPPGAQASLGSIAALRAGLDQGTISQVQFDNGVAMHAKRIRATVPRGYGPMVESALSAAVGSSTANQARQTNLAAIDAANRAGSAEVSDLADFMKRADVSEVLLDPVVMEDFRRRSGGMTIEQMVQNPDPTQRANLELAVATRKAENSKFKLWEQNQTMGKASSKDDVRFVVDKVLVDSIYNNTSGEMFDFLQKKAQFEKSGGIIDNEEATQLASHWAKVSTDAFDRLNKALITSRADTDTRKEMVAELKDILKPYEDSIISKDFGALNMLANSNKYMEDQAIQKLYRTQTFALPLSVMNKMGTPSDVTLAYFMPTSDEQIEYAKQVVAVTSAISMASGDKSGDEVIKILEETRKNPKAEIKGTFDSLAGMMNHPDNTPEGVANIAANVFSAKNRELLSRISVNQQAALFEQLMSPVVVDKVVKSGNQDAINAMQQWGTLQFDVISKMAKDTIMDAQQNRLMADIRFENNRFVWSPRNPTTGEKMTALSTWEWERGGAVDAYQAVTNINRYIAAMEPVWAKDKMTPAMALSRMQWQDVNQIEKAPTLLSTLGNAIYNMMGTENGKQSNAGVISGTANASISKEERPATNEELTAQAQPKTSGKSVIAYANQGATRNLKLTNKLESNIDKAVREVYGEGYTVQVFSGGQPKKGSGGKRTGSIRHDEGKAADVYIIGPDGKRVTDTDVLDRLVDHWENKGLGSVGRYMRGGGIHLDEWTKDQLLAGMGSSWRY